MNWYLEALKKYAVFRGGARRAEPEKTSIIIGENRPIRLKNYLFILSLSEGI